MSTTNHYEQGDLALFALQLLPRSEYATMSMHIADCTYCRQELAQLQGDLAAYAHTIDLHSPPALVRERLSNQIAREKRFNPIQSSEPERPFASSPTPERFERPERSEPSERRQPLPAERGERIESGPPETSQAYSRRSQSYPTGLGSGRYTEDDSQEIDVSPVSQLVAKVFPWVGWAAAAGLAIVAGNLYHERDAQRGKIVAQATTIERLSSDAAGAKQLLETITDPLARQATLSRASGAAVPAVPQGKVTYVASKGALIFLASNLEPVEAYKTYELWVIPADNRDPIPAGTFHPDARGNASIILPPLPKGIEAKAFGVTIEDDGGSQTPTMPIVLAGS